MTSPRNMVKEKLKVLWVSHYIPYPPKAGVLIRGYSLVKELSKEVELDLFLFDQPRLRQTFFHSAEENIEALRQNLPEQSIGHIELNRIPSERGKLSKLRLFAKSALSNKSYTELWLQSDEAKNKLATLLSKTHYDLVHLDTISLHFLKDVIPADLPCVLDHHNIESHMVYRRYEQENNLLKKLFLFLEAKKLSRYERQNCNKYALNIVCSNDDKNRLQEIDSSLHVEVIPNGISVEGAPTAYSPKPKKLLFIGGLSWYPNLQGIEYILSDVLPRLVKHHPEITFDIVGKGAPKTLVAKYKDDKNVTFHGFVDDITSFYDDATIYIAPILDGGGTKLKVLDAMANNVPLLTTTLGVEGIDVEHGTHCLIADSPNEIVNAVLQLMSDKNLATKLTNNALNLVRRCYSYEAIGEKIRAEYSTLR